jgi:hypothetical protein
METLSTVQFTAAVSDASTLGIPFKPKNSAFSHQFFKSLLRRNMFLKNFKESVPDYK